MLHTLLTVDLDNLHLFFACSKLCLDLCHSSILFVFQITGLPAFSALLFLSLLAVELHNSLHDVWGKLPKALVRFFVPDKASPELRLHKHPWRAIWNVVAVLRFVIFLASSVREVIVPCSEPTAVPTSLRSTM